MGFTLTLTEIPFIVKDEIANIIGGIHVSKGISPIQGIDPEWCKNSPILQSSNINSEDHDNEEEESSDACFAITHLEVGWSWWDQVATQLATIPELEGAPNSNHMKAWLSAAIQIDVGNAFIGEKSPVVYPQNEIDLSRLHEDERRVFERDQLIQQMIFERTGGLENFRIGNAPKILAELETGCNFWYLPTDETESQLEARRRYENEPDSDIEIAMCYALIARSMLRLAAKHQLIVWFIK